jgi:hypothetical protein
VGSLGCISLPENTKQTTCFQGIIATKLVVDRNLGGALLAAQELDPKFRKL